MWAMKVLSRGKGQSRAERQERASFTAWFVVVRGGLLSFRAFYIAGTFFHWEIGDCWLCGDATYFVWNGDGSSSLVLLFKQIALVEVELRG
jgi:hypothetical protein